MSPSLTKLAHLPSRDDLHGFTLPADAAELIDHVVVPLSLALADDHALAGGCDGVRKAVENV
jgi:hypothetical protein